MLAAIGMGKKSPRRKAPRMGKSDTKFWCPQKGFFERLNNLKIIKIKHILGFISEMADCKEIQH